MQCLLNNISANYIKFSTLRIKFTVTSCQYYQYSNIINTEYDMLCGDVTFTLTWV